MSGIVLSLRGDKKTEREEKTRIHFQWNRYKQQCKVATAATTTPHTVGQWLYIYQRRYSVVDLHRDLCSGGELIFTSNRIMWLPFPIQSVTISFVQDQVTDTDTNTHARTHARYQTNICSLAVCKEWKDTHIFPTLTILSMMICWVSLYLRGH